MSTNVIWYDCGDGCAVGLPEGQPEYDSESRHCTEPYGLHIFAWLPVKCRNGKIRWLCGVERHRDGTYTLGRLK